MLIFDIQKAKYIVDPHFWTILPFKKIREADKNPDKHIAECKAIWIYHMYNPHSPFRDHRNKEKSDVIVRATFPKSFLEVEERKLQALINDAVIKNKEIDVLSDTVVEGGEMVVKHKEYAHVPTLRLYDPAEDENVLQAAEWYKNHLQQTPLWYSYESYKEAMYNLSDIIRDRSSSASNIKSASSELDLIPLKMEKMKQQAIKDEATTVKIQGAKSIKRGEMLESHASRKQKLKASAE